MKKLNQLEILKTTKLSNIKGGKRVSTYTISEATKILMANPTTARVVGLQGTNVCVEW